MTRKIVITGPESTGKSRLVKELAQKYSATYYSEYAREYIENLDRPYAYFDLVNIARVQIEQLRERKSNKTELIFYDTGPEITKVWFDEVYGKCPDFVNQSTRHSDINLYLICKPDIEWIFDKVRENNGSKREKLYSRYKELLENNNLKFTEVSDFGQKRTNNAIQAINSAQDLQN
ncbi:MAG: ATP-binding protein [Bacteroidota bacterium]|nr:ATP-binding protein [Bacteroidota bacterium]